MSVDRFIEFFRRRQRNYQLSLQKSNPHAQSMLADMADYCCVNRSTAVGDNPYKTARLEGRREAFQFMARAYHLTPEEQFALVNKKDSP